MASLNAPGVPVVSKLNTALRSYSKNIALTTNLNPYGQNSVRAIAVTGVPPEERTAASFGTQSSPAKESFLRMTNFTKHTESETDTTVAQITGSVPVDANSQAEIALIEEHTRHEAHLGTQIVEKETVGDTEVRRISNVGERPGGEI